MTGKKPSNESLPPLYVDKEDREAFARQRQTKPSNSSGERPSAPVNVEKSKAAKSQGGRGLAWFALLVALSGYGGTWILHEQLTIRTMELQSAAQRIDELERQLSITGEELGESSGTLQTQLVQLSNKTDKLWSEMDKLWASAWRKNQSQIKALDGKVAANSQQMKTANNGIETNKKSLWKYANKTDKSEQRLTSMEQQMPQTDQRIVANSDMLIAIEDVLQGMEESTVMLTNGNVQRDTAIAALDQQLRQMREQNQRLEKQLKTLNEWRQNQSLQGSVTP